MHVAPDECVDGIAITETADVLIQREVDESIRVKRAFFQTHVAGICRAAQLCIEAIARGNKLLFAGNGGSAADSQHLAAELVGRYRLERRAFAAIALTTDTSALTAIGNDYGYVHVFERQIHALAGRGDVLFAISTSGNSENLVLATRAARTKGLQVIGLLGNNGGRLRDEVDLALVVPAATPDRVQETHITFGHVLCGLIESTLAGHDQTGVVGDAQPPTVLHKLC